MSRAPITRDLAAFASEADYERLPPEVIAHLKLLLLDLSGIMIRAGAELASTARLLEGLRALEFGAGSVRAFSVPESLPPAAAALCDAMAAHSLDFDDTHGAASTHPGAATVAAGLACAQLAGASGREVLAALAAGYEVHLRLSLGLVPSEHYARGHALTSTCGTFAAAATAGRLLGLTPAQMEQAFGLCLNQASGSLQFLDGGTWGKRFQVGYAAFNGVVAALLARAGFEGVRNPIEGRHGFLHNYSGAPNPDAVLDGLGETYVSLKTGVKPYPVCRYAHAAMDAVIALRDRHGIAPEEVSRIEIGLGRVGHELVGIPAEEKRRPKTFVDGQFSMPYCAAVALVEGGMTWDDLQRHLESSATLALCRKVEVVLDPQAEASAPRWMSGSAAIDTLRGRFTEFVEIPLGEPEIFPAADRLEAKLHGLVAPYLNAEAERALVNAIGRLESLADVTELHKAVQDDTRTRFKKGA